MATTFAEQLREWRGKSYQKEAAEKLGIPLSTFRKFENGKRTPPKLIVEALKMRMENATQ